MLTPNELEAASMWLDEPMRKLERQVMEDIIRRIKINGEITRAADWQINRLTQLGILRGEIDEAIKNALDLDDRALSELYAKAIHSGYIRSQALYKAVGKQPAPFAENGALQQLIFSVAAQTRGTMQNITQSLGFAVRDVNGRLYWNDLSHYCQQTLDNAVLGIATGLFDYNTVIKRTVSDMTNSGLRTFDYATGWKNRVDVAARRAVMTGLTQLTGQLNEQTAADLDTEYFEVSLHGGARPEHAEWQGRVWTKRQLETECGLGSVTGLCGANCRHNYYPFVPGISERTYTDEYLDEFKKQQAEKHEFNGKKYDAYQATQRQRALETTMRAQRQKIHLLEAGGADEQDIINARAQYRKTSGEYTRFSREMGLPQQRERITVDGLRAVGVGKTKGAKEIPQIRPAPIGAKRRGKVSDAERGELLYRGNNKLLTSAANGGIINYLEFNDGQQVNDFFYYDTEERSLTARRNSFHSKWERSLTDEEKSAIVGYAGGEYEDINSYWRRKSGWQQINSKFVESESHRIDRAIERYELKDNITVQRGVGSGILDRLIEQFDVQYDLSELVGKTFVEQGYSSSSVLLGNPVVTVKPVVLEIDVPSGKGRGAYINRLSGFQDTEYEFLIKRNASFTIKQIKEEKNFGEYKYFLKVVMNDE